MALAAGRNCRIFINKMIGKPKYNLNDVVTFKIKDEHKQIEEYTGTIFIVDAYGTFFQEEEPSYDILVKLPDGDCLFKHIRESFICK